jgi:aryl-alcohol dehydrogenase-like predicted oxidoreductase
MAHRHESPAMIHGASDPGVTLTDTGDLYAKLLIIEALKGRRRDQAVLSVDLGALHDPAGGWSCYDARSAGEQ